jgi:hypothetical protein
MKRIIQWESQHLEVDPLTGKLISPDSIEENIKHDDEPEYDDDIVHKKQIQNLMSTPFGLWKVDDVMHPYRQFELWMGNANFTITDEIADTLERVPGVEVLQIMSRYKFIIGVGKLFDFHEVRLAIEKHLSCNISEESMIGDKSVIKKIHDLKARLSQYNQWAIFVFPNGNIDFTTSNEKDFYEQLNLYRMAVDYSSGILIENENG